MNINDYSNAYPSESNLAKNKITREHVDNSFNKLTTVISDTISDAGTEIQTVFDLSESLTKEFNKILYGSELIDSESIQQSQLTSDDYRAKIAKLRSDYEKYQNDTLDKLTSFKGDLDKRSKTVKRLDTSLTKQPEFIRQKLTENVVETDETQVLADLNKTIVADSSKPKPSTFESDTKTYTHRYDVVTHGVIILERIDIDTNDLIKSDIVMHDFDGFAQDGVKYYHNVDMNNKWFTDIDGYDLVTMPPTNTTYPIADNNPKLTVTIYYRKKRHMKHESEVDANIDISVNNIDDSSIVIESETKQELVDDFKINYTVLDGRSVTTTYQGHMQADEPTELPIIVNNQSATLTVCMRSDGVLDISQKTLISGPLSTLDLTESELPDSLDIDKLDSIDALDYVESMSNDELDIMKRIVILAQSGYSYRFINSAKWQELKQLRKLQDDFNSDAETITDAILLTIMNDLVNIHYRNDVDDISQYSNNLIKFTYGGRIVPVVVKREEYDDDSSLGDIYTDLVIGDTMYNVILITHHDDILVVSTVNLVKVKSEN